MNSESPGFYFDQQALSGLKNAARDSARDGGHDPETLRQVASQFESLYLNMLFKSMREASPEEGLMDSQQTSFFRDMLDKQRAVEMASSGGIGLADLLVRQLAEQSPSAALDSAAPGDVDAAILRRNYDGLPLRSERAGLSLDGGAGGDGFLALDESRVDARWRQAPARPMPLPQRPSVAPAAASPMAASPVAPPEQGTRPLIDGLPAVQSLLAALEMPPAPRPAWQLAADAAVARAAGQVSGVAAGESAVARGMARDAVPAPLATTALASTPPAPAPGGAATAAVGPWDDPRDFVRDLWPHAQRAAERLGVPAEAIVAQSALETGWGRKLPLRADGTPSYNLFGIKADTRWPGERLAVDTLEFEGEGFVSRREPFRAYPGLAEAVDDYAEFLTANPRYQRALAAGDDSAAFARELQAAGYATDPAYASKIQRIVAGDTLATALAALPVELSSGLKGGGGAPTSS